VAASSVVELEPLRKGSCSVGVCLALDMCSDLPGRDRVVSHIRCGRGIIPGLEHMFAQLKGGVASRLVFVRPRGRLAAAVDIPWRRFRPLPSGAIARATTSPGRGVPRGVACSALVP
jgi:hypothetical protein